MDLEQLDLNSPRGALVRYFDVAHDALLWKLEGLAEYDLRRPLTPTGTNLLGLLKHLAFVELGYFGDVFDRPHDIAMPAHDTINADMYATADETVADIRALFDQARAHALATIDALELDAEGHVPWWGEAGNPVTLQRIIIHMATELHRHLGQADILREHIDGATGHRPGVENMPDVDADYWPAYVAELERIARAAT